MKRVFVYGWYGQGNLGDEAFKLSFLQLWPDYEFTFSSVIPTNVNEQYDALWIGGGSFLEQTIPRLDYVKLPMGFFGVGSTSSPSNAVREALDKAKIVVFRDTSYAHLWSACVLPDLVFARSDIKPLDIKKKKQITVFANDFVTPYGKVMEWKSLSYYWYLQEFSKILDRLSVSYTINMFPMCVNSRVDDRRASAAIIGRSEHPHRYNWMLEAQNELALRTSIQESEFVITQRFHGLIYSLLEGVPCVTVTTHNKFASLCRELELPVVDFYGLTDASFGAATEQLGGFFSSKVEKYKKEAIQNWRDMAEMVTYIF